MSDWLTLVLPLAVSWGLTAALVRLAPRLGLLDLPDERKVHTRPVPRGGGLAIYAAGLAGTLLPAARTPLLLTVLGLGGGIVLLGLLDDLRPLSWQVRLGVQGVIVLAFLLLWPGQRAWWLQIIAWVWLVGLVNAFNMLDNMDALSAGTACVASLVLALAVVLRQDGPWNWGLAAPYLVLLGAAAGFLWFNRPPARIFMGDAGSTFLGFYLGAFSLAGGLVEEAPQTWAVPLCVLAVPWYDLTLVVLLRLRQGRSPFQADKQHVSHRLVLLGLKPPVAVSVIHLLGLGSGLGGLLLYFVPDRAAWLVGGQLAAWWLAVALVEYAPRFQEASALKNPEGPCGSAAG